MSKLVLVTDITVPCKLKVVISETRICFDLFMLFCKSEILPSLTSLKELSKYLFLTDFFEYHNVSSPALNN